MIKIILGALLGSYLTLLYLRGWWHRLPWSVLVANTGTDEWEFKSILTDYRKVDRW
jgi:hypothetical protein